MRGKSSLSGTSHALVVWCFIAGCASVAGQVPLAAMSALSSVSNPRVKQLRLWMDDNRKRKHDRVVIIEGAKELELAERGRLNFSELWVCPDIVANDAYLAQWLARHRHIPTLDVTRELFEKLAYRGTTGGVIAVAKAENLALKDVHLSKNPLILVMAGVEKPGNLGAMLRTADAANLDAVVVCDPLADLFNPNVIRSSLGCVFTVPVITTTSQQALAWLIEHQIQTLCTALTASKPYTEANFTKPTAIVMGTEHDGLPREWLEASRHNIIIPMLGHIDSLNVSTAAAIVVFEALRQRSS